MGYVIVGIFIFRIFIIINKNKTIRLFQVIYRRMSAIVEHKYCFQKKKMRINKNKTTV